MGGVKNLGLCMYVCMYVYSSSVNQVLVHSMSKTFYTSNNNPSSYFLVFSFLVLV